MLVVPYNQQTVLVRSLRPRAGVILGITRMAALGLPNGPPAHLHRVHLPKPLSLSAARVGHRQALMAAQVATTTEPCPEARVAQVDIMVIALRRQWLEA